MNIALKRPVAAGPFPPNKELIGFVILVDAGDMSFNVLGVRVRLSEDRRKAKISWSRAPPGWNTSEFPRQRRRSERRRSERRRIFGESISDLTVIEWRPTQEGINSTSS